VGRLEVSRFRVDQASRLARRGQACVFTHRSRRFVDHGSVANGSREANGRRRDARDHADAICFFQPKPRPTLHSGWGIFAFPISGFLQGLVGMGGPAMVLWVQAHDWNTRQSRGFLFTMYLISIVPAIALLYIAFGDRIIEPSIIALAMTPLLLLVTSLGLTAGTKLGRKRLRRITLGVLILIGVCGLIAPWFP
jgi:uncharacterized membrane protein YfcA